MRERPESVWIYLTVWTIPRQAGVMRERGRKGVPAILPSAAIAVVWAREHRHIAGMNRLSLLARMVMARLRFHRGGR